MAALLLFGSGAHAQFVVTNSNGADNTPTGYATFADAITALTGTSQAGFQPLLTLGADITVAITIPAHDWDSLFIRPSGQRHISFSVNSATIATVLFSGATNVVIDGIDADHDAPDRLIINNPNTGTSAHTIRFENGASGNTIKNCTVRGATTANSTTQTGAVILFWTPSATTGNSNNTIANCRIRNANASPATFTTGTLLPSRAIYSRTSGTASIVDNLARNNTGNRVLNNWIFNYFLGSSTSQGIFLGLGNHQWTIQGNRFFQEEARVYPSSGTYNHRMIDVDQATTSAAAGGHVVRENILGFAASDGSGVYDISAWGNIVRGIYLDVPNTGPRNTISGNVINGITHSSTSSSGDVIQFILINSGQVDADDNLIGNIDGAAATITLTSGSPSPGAGGIVNLGGLDLRTRNNRIGGITMSQAGLNGIRNAGSGTWTCTDNEIGGTFGLRVLTAQSSPIVKGLVVAGSVTATIENNDIRNLILGTNNSNQGGLGLRGVEITTSSTAGQTVKGNTIYNLVASKPSTNTSFWTVAVYGVHSTRAVTVENNTIYSLSASSTASGLSTTTHTATVRGIWVTGASAHLTALNNTIDNLEVANTGNPANRNINVQGIRSEGSSVQVEVRGNRISRLLMDGRSTADAADGDGSLMGINIIGGTGTPTAVVEDNQVYGLENSGIQNILVYATGIRMASAGTNTIARNTVHSIRASRGTGTTALTSTPTGIWVAGGTTNTVVNNMVRIGLDADGTQEDRGYRARGVWTTATGTINLHHNSVYVGGESVASSAQSSHALFCENTATRDIRNNILWNARESFSTPGTGVHYAMHLPNLTTLTTDHNCLRVTGSNGDRHVVRASTTNYTNLSDWQTPTRDFNSISEDAPFLNAVGDTANVDLHLDIADPDAGLFNGTGVGIAEVTDDIDGDLRQSPPDIGADEICLPVAGTITPDPAELCAGEASNLTLTGQSSGSEYTYQWRASTTAGGPYADELGTGTTQATGTLTETTYYVVDVTCSLAPGPTVVSVTTPELEVTVFPLPTASLSDGGAVCSVDPLPDVTFTFTGTAPYDFAYTIDAGTPVAVNGHGTNTFTITSAGAGTYAVTSLSDARCTGTDLGGTVEVSVTPATTWYADTDSDGYGDPNVSVEACTQPVGFVANADDCDDTDPNLTFPGDSCDDGDPNTENDTVTASCTCEGTPTGAPCTTDLFFVYAVGNNHLEVVWNLHEAGTGNLVQTGGVFSVGNGSVPTCLPNGSFYLRVTDAGGDGIAGGYQLTTAGGQRIIDNTDNFNSGGLSAIANNGEFNIPVGTDRPIFTSCDKMWWKTGEFLVAAENPAVSAVWVNGPNTAQSPNSGYEFWWYDPNGGYSFRRFRPHTESDGFANVGATRACHVRLNNWAAANHLPEGQFLNVKVRGRVNGVNQNWGTACRFTLDNALADCPPTKLMDIPGHPQYSCGEIRSLERGQRVYARPVRGATHYQWRFRVPAEEPVIQAVTVTTNVFHVQLNTLGLLYGKTYEVEVRASKNGTVSWCGTGNQDPAVLSPKWGDVCLLTIALPPPMTGPDVEGITDGGGLRMWPNPNRGDQLWIHLDGIAAGVETVTVDLYDLSGKRIAARVLPTQGDHLNTVLDLNGDLAGGMYVVHVTAGERMYIERLVVQP